MRLTFIEEEGVHYVLAFDQVYDGRMCQEWMFAEIAPMLGVFMLRWEDSYNSPMHFTTFEEARIYVEKNHFRHNPLPNGQIFIVDDND